MNGKNTIVAVDIGGTKITTCIARVHSEGEIEVLALASHEAKGIRLGAIGDVKLARSSILASIIDAEKMCKKRVTSIITNVSHPSIKNSLVKIMTNFNNKQILAQDLALIEANALKQIDLSKYEYLSKNILWHNLDDMSEVNDPEFMFGGTLVSYINIVTIPIKHLINLSSCLQGCQLKVSNFVLSAYASALACASDEEMEEGCVVVDIGSETLDYVILKNKKIVNSGTIPLAGNAITQDVAQYFSLSLKEAERIKVLHGRLYDFISDEQMLIQTDNNNVTNAMLNKVIRARFEEIITILLSTLKSVKAPDACFNNMIFTGGCSNIEGLEDFLKQNFLLKVRKGMPEPSKIKGNFESDPSLATILGMVVYALKSDPNISHTYLSPFKKAVAWLKENL
jgi:cell division protein FtsA